MALLDALNKLNDALEELSVAVSDAKSKSALDKQTINDMRQDFAAAYERIETALKTFEPEEK